MKPQRMADATRFTMFGKKIAARKKRFSILHIRKQMGKDQRDKEDEEAAHEDDRDGVHHDDLPEVSACGHSRKLRRPTNSVSLEKPLQLVQADPEPLDSQKKNSVRYRATGTTSAANPNLFASARMKTLGLLRSALGPACGARRRGRKKAPWGLARCYPHGA